MKYLSQNKKALHDYQILERFEAGIVLQGPEVKSVKLGRMELAGSYVVPQEGELFLVGAHIPPYQPANTPDSFDPTRQRKLLMSKKEIATLLGKSSQKGLTLVPTAVYAKSGIVKLEVAVGKGKRTKDKREILKKRDADREIDRLIKSR